jgi:hypothetical protein
MIVSQDEVLMLGGADRVGIVFKVKDVKDELYFPKWRPVTRTCVQLSKTSSVLWDRSSSASIYSSPPAGPGTECHTREQSVGHGNRLTETWEQGVKYGNRLGEKWGQIGSEMGTVCKIWEQSEVQNVQHVVGEVKVTPLLSYETCNFL